ncbi:MAG TPA: hypothetical protein VHX16_06345 [Chloroflexota bacterium]|jgi:hypothetical protein|nr:hypothetical protein [Chloroflexota bacterium]
MMRSEGARSTVDLLRRGILGLAALSLIATGLELGMEQHWKEAIQLVPWLALVVVLVSIGLVARSRPSRRQVRIAQALAVLVMLSAAYGVYEHVAVNYDSAPLDRRYGDTWDAMSEPSRWWTAVTHQVGPSPPLAPLALAYGAVCVLLATFWHSSTDSETGTGAPPVQRI